MATFHDLLDFHFNGDEFSVLCLVRVGFVALQSVDGQLTITYGGDVVVFEKHHLVCVFNDSTANHGWYGE